MKNQIASRWLNHCLRLCFLCLIIIGVFLRIWGVDQKPLWCDESLTLIRTSGYAESEILPQLLYPKTITSFGEINQYLSINPNQPFKNTWNALKHHPEHPPLYYVTVHFWRRIFGDSIAVTRLFSVFISLLILPCAYWLCIELFQSPKVAWSAVILMSISPLHIYYAQEAREYILWALTTLLSSAALLKARRKKNSLCWFLYGLSLTANFYAHLFGFLLIIGHCIYIFLINSLRLTKEILIWLTISSMALISFAVWPFILTKTYKIISLTGGAQSNLSLFERLKYWVHNFLLVFIDGRYMSNIIETQNKIGIYFGFLIILIVLIVFITFILVKTSQNTGLFLVSLLGSIWIPFVLVDFYFSWKISSSIRYLMPFWIIIEIIFAYNIAQFISKRVNLFFNKKIKSRIVELTLVIMFCVPIAFMIHHSWRLNKGGFLYSLSHESFISVLNQEKNVLLINTNNASFCSMLSWSYYLDPNIKLILVSTFPSDKKITIKISPTQNNELFLFDALNISSKFVIESENLNKRELVAEFKGKKLWKLEQYE